LVRQNKTNIQPTVESEYWADMRMKTDSKHDRRRKFERCT